MSAQLLEGKIIAKDLRESIKKEVEQLSNKYGIPPVLASVQVGSDPGSSVYIKSQRKVAEGLGIRYNLHSLEENICHNELVKFIKYLNEDKTVNGIIVQMPLPKQIKAGEISELISPVKDAEGMHPENLGKVVLASAGIAPCTPMAVMELIKASGVDLYGREAVVVGHSEIVGKPVSLLLLSKFATATVCHIGTAERGLLEEHIKRAEVLVVAVGKAGLVKGEWIKQGAVVIDVGINRVDGKIVGDVEFEGASERAAYITPVPGGVGPITVTMLMRNVLEAFRLQVTSCRLQV